MKNQSQQPTLIVKRSMQSFIICGYLILASPSSMSGQSGPDFWKSLTNLPTKEGENVFYTLSSDVDRNILYAGTTYGIIKSTDKGESWNLVLPAISGPFTHIKARNGWVLATGSRGTWFLSKDEGQTWNNGMIGSGILGITDILITADQSLLIATGYIFELNGAGHYAGQGLYRSDDEGKNWKIAGNKLETSAYITHLREDSFGRIIAGVNGSQHKDGRLLLSDDKAGTWIEFYDISFDWGDGEIFPTKIREITSLEIDPNDRIFISFVGSAQSAATSVTLVNNWQNIMDGHSWDHFRTLDFGFPWFYQGVHNIYFSEKGDIYINRAGNSLTVGSIFYSQFGSSGFIRKDIAPVWDGNIAYYNYVSFAPLSDGTLFVAQHADFRLYVSTQSRHTPTHVRDREVNLPEFSIYPNPTRDILRLDFNDTISSEAFITVYDMAGRIQFRHPVETFRNGTPLSIRNFKSGKYLLVLEYNGATRSKVFIKHD